MRETELELRLRADLDQRDRAGLRRTLRAPSGIDLSSNDYLGLATHAEVKRRMAAAVCELGVGSTGSRLLRGERTDFSLLEHRFAQFKNAERSLYFSSGYQANIAVLSTFAEEADVIFSDERNHASLIDGARLSRARKVIYPHADVAALARFLESEREARQKFVVTETLFSMDGDFAPLPALAALCREHEAALIVDEAHAVGLYGARGSGCTEASGIEDDVFLSINTAGKALGVAGAFVAGSDNAIETLIQRARPFIFSTAPPPALAAALEASLDLIAAEPERRELVLARSKFLRAELELEGTSQIIPFLLGSNERAVTTAAALQDRGFDVRAIRPPTVAEGTARLRISVNMNLTEDVLHRFAAALQEISCAVSS